MKSPWLARVLVALLTCTGWAASPAAAQGAARIFQAGSAKTDITPPAFPVIVNGMFEERSATQALDPLHSRALILDDGAIRIAFVVVDTCMMPRDLIEEAKAAIAAESGIPRERVMVCATHTHSAPAAMGCLGSRVDPGYAKFLPGKIAESVALATANLRPAKVGWGSVESWEHTFCRRWIRRPDRLMHDPFGAANVRAHMHPGHESPDAIAPSGPVDPELAILSVRDADGKPLALLANYSMHYYESPLLSADYFGVFARETAKLLGASEDRFTAMMSQGTSGDQMWMDYGSPRNQIGMEAYGRELAELAAGVCRSIQHHDWVPLGMNERRVTLDFRTPGAERLQWAKELSAKIGDRLPRGLAEIYALEALHLHARPTAELVLQAIRVGDLAIATFPNEVYALTGLKTKRQSPFGLTFNIELANGSEGYIPPPEQHRLGGYTTWPARTAGLETHAEPTIVATLLGQLEELAARPRKPLIPTHGSYARAILADQPSAYFRLEEMGEGPVLDAAGSAHGAFLGNLAFWLPGPDGAGFSAGNINRAIHLAGGGVEAPPLPGGSDYTLEFWFWNGLPSEARAVTGRLASMGPGGDQLWIGGATSFPGRLVFANSVDGAPLIAGRTALPLKTWHHLALVRRGAHVSIHLNGLLEAEGELPRNEVDPSARWRIGAGADFADSFEGKLDEIAIYPRALPAGRIAHHFALARQPSNAAPKPDGAAAVPPSPLSPAQSLDHLEVDPAFKVQLAASEPLVASPVAIDWGLDGKLWVVEMPDYPYGMDGNMKPGGRVKYLEDLDGDGLFDRSTLFMDGVNFPNGIITWRNGVIITAAPDIFYAEDTDGDGRADRREVLYTGFNEGNLQLRVNGLRWGLDNWLHCANGWSGGEPRSIRAGAAININGQDLRIRPDDGAVEPESGQSEFGRNPDDWGNWHGCDNSHPLFQFMVEQRYLRRNPHIPSAETRRQLIPQSNPKVYPRSLGQKRYHSFEHASHYTSACSSDFYRDEWLFSRDGPPQVFVCEPVHNLVQRLSLRGPKNQTSLEVELTPSGHDFLTSEDPWFRPVMARMGPDGALWVVDMYRHMIEHPDWLPPEGREELRPFYRLGENRGRIYRVTPAARSGLPPRDTVPRLDKLSPVELAGQLDSPNGWIRDKAHQALLWNPDASALPALEHLAAKGEIPLGRLHALCVLDGLGKLSEPTCLQALSDPHPEIRRHAIRLSEQFANQSEPLFARLGSLADDPDPALRLQLACTLGEWSDPRAGLILAKLATAPGGGPWINLAVQSSAVPHLASLAEALAGGRLEREPHEPLLLRLAFAARNPAALAAILSPFAAPADPDIAFTTLRRFLELSRTGQNDPASWPKPVGDPLAPSLAVIPRLFTQARDFASNPSTPLSTRLKAAGLLGLEPSGVESDLRLLDTLAHPPNPSDLQIAAARAILATAHPGVPALFLRRWPTHFPAFRAVVLDGLLAREGWASELLDAVERGLVSPAELGASRTGRLVGHRSDGIKARASKLLMSSRAGGREEVRRAFATAATLQGDPLKGVGHFNHLCASCHLAHGLGREVGPNLVTVRDQGADKLLAAVLDPSGEVEPRFLAYSCETTSGEEFYGIIVNEVGDAVELKLSDGQSKSIPRSEIVRLQSSQTSLMPDGLEAGLTPQDMADLLAFVKYGPPNPAQ